MRPTALASAAVLFAGPAFADVTLELTMKGYSDLFKECEFDIDVSADGGYGAVEFEYQLPIEGKGVQECSARISITKSLETHCSAPPDFHYSCEEFQHLRLLSMDCEDKSGRERPCGSVTLRAPEKGMFLFPDD